MAGSQYFGKTASEQANKTETHKNLAHTRNSNNDCNWSCWTVQGLAEGRSKVIYEVLRQMVGWGVHGYYIDTTLIRVMDGMDLRPAYADTIIIHAWPYPSQILFFHHHARTNNNAWSNKKCVYVHLREQFRALPIHCMIVRLAGYRDNSLVSSTAG